MSKFAIPLLAPNNYDADALSELTGIDTGQESVVQHSFAEEADINVIVRRFGLTGQLPQNLQMPQSGDFTGVTDFHQAMNLVRQAEEEFMRVPADVRARFHNDPGELMAFLDDEANRPEAIKLGLVSPPPEKDREGNPAPSA